MAGIEPLRQLFEPQVEQFGLGRTGASTVGGGELYQGSNERADGWLWVCGIDGDCLVAVHDVGVSRPFVLQEEPDSSICLASMSRSTVSCWFDPKGHEAPVRAPSRDENVVAFSQERRPVSGMLDAGRRYVSASVTVKPGLFARNGAGRAYRRLDERLARCDDGALYDLPVGLRAVMRSITRSAEAVVLGTPAVMGSEAGVRAKVATALAGLVDHFDQLELAERNAGEADQLRLVLQAQNIIDGQIDSLVTLDELSRRLNVGRTRLCAAFKAETGTSIGAWARSRRVERACELLAEGRLGMAEVARSVGYDRLGSFDVMFRAQTGLSPSEWVGRT